MDHAHKAFSGVFWSVITNVVNAAYGFIATPLLISYFGRSEFGIIALAQSVNAYMGLMDIGLSSTNVRFFSNWLAKGNSEKVTKLMQTCTAFYGIVGIINAIALIIISFFSDTLFNVSENQNIVLQQMLWILSLTALVNWYTSCFGQLISATENVAWVQKRTLLTKFFMICTVCVTLVLKLTILQYFIGITIAGLIILPQTIKKIKTETPFISFKAKFDLDTFKEILPYSLNIFSFGFFQFSFNNLRTVFLGMQGNVAYVTDYGVMAGIAGLVSMIGNVFLGALLPASSRIVANKDKDAFNRVAYQGTHYITMVLCFCAFGLMSIDKDLMMVYVGDKFMHLIPWLNLWLCLTITGNVSCISSLILGGSYIRPLTYSSAIACIFGLATCWLTTPYWGAGGVVLSMLAYNIVQELFYYCYYWPKILKINSLRIFIRTDIPFVSLGACSFLLTAIIPHTSNHWTNIFIFGTIFAVTYTLSALAILKRDDRQYLYQLIRRK